MEAFSDIFDFMAGVPAMAGLIITGLTIFLTSDWRLSLTGLLVQYVMIGLALTRFVQAEVAILKILVGVLAVSILYLTGRRIQEAKGPQILAAGGQRFLGLQISWGAGPLSLPLRLLAVLLVSLALLLFYDRYSLVLLSADITFVATWLAAMGVIGLVLSSDPLRVAPATLTILAAFDLVYAGLEPSLAIVGFSGALILLAALSFSYLGAAQIAGHRPTGSGEEMEP
jgi:hypothetical protein